DRDRAVEGEQIVEAGAELRRTRPRGVGAELRDPPPGVGGAGVLLRAEAPPAAESLLVAVSDGQLACEVFDLPLGGCGVAARAREAPDVHELLDAGACEQARELLAVQAPVAEGQHPCDSATRRADSLGPPYDRRHDPDGCPGRADRREGPR